MERLALKRKQFKRRKLRIKGKLKKSSGNPRLCLYRSNKGFYAQIVDDAKGHTITSASSYEKDFPEMKNCGNKEAAKVVGERLAKKAVEKGIKKVVFDRNGYLYHGKVKEFAEAVRKNGLEF